MNYEEFLQEVRGAGLDFGKGETLSIEWTTGGDRGSDCYGKDYGQFDAEPEPDFHALHIAMEKVAPAITYLQMRRLERELVGYKHRTHDDYYGVHEDISTKFVLLKELHAWPVSNGLIKLPASSG